MVQRIYFRYVVYVLVVLSVKTLLMGKMFGNKRKKDKKSPNQSVEQENKRILMASMNSFRGSSPIQGMSQPGHFIAPTSFQYTPSMGGMFGTGLL